MKIDDVFKASLSLIDRQLIDENVQVNGYVLLVDVTGYTLRHQMFIGIDSVIKVTKIFLVSADILIRHQRCYNKKRFNFVFITVEEIDAINNHMVNIYG